MDAKERRSRREAERSTFARFFGLFDFRLLQQYRHLTDIASLPNVRFAKVDGPYRSLREPFRGERPAPPCRLIRFSAFACQSRTDPVFCHPLPVAGSDAPFAPERPLCARINGIDLVEELDNRERLFRRADQIRGIVGRLLPACRGEEAGMATHDDGHRDAGHGAKIEIYTDKGIGDEGGGRMKPGT